MADRINIPMDDITVIQVVLDLSQTRCRTRLLTAEQVVAAANEAERTFDAIGLTQAERIGIRIEVSSSERHFAASYRGVPHATFAQLRRTRTGWRLTAAGRRVNRNMRSTWLATELPTSDVLARAARRVLRRGTDGRPRL
ncbi:hypothetical protein [Microbacterium sp. zg-YB36]|uniref:hypothetical protein n=1 Tax=Microbacterium sp. zg-YB36 TaxID=2969407 RepID=UPI00214D0578|nr:hypothetical protein [Microbacterium sp. zg-YB36]MDL5352166.1 hypothetical protein [Microbacterium sp. zg-YB36]